MSDVPAFDVMDSNILEVCGEDWVSTYCVWQTLRQHDLGYGSLSWNTIDRRLWRLEALGFAEHKVVEQVNGRTITYWRKKQK